MSRILPNQNKKRIFTTYGRLNEVTEDYTAFDITKYPNYYVPARMQSMTLRDALVDPHQTATSYTDPLVRKDPGYVELNKRSQIEQDMTSKVIKDCNGNQIVRLSQDHGLRNGGLICQTSHGRSLK